MLSGCRSYNSVHASKQMRLMLHAAKSSSDLNCFFSCPIWQPLVANWNIAVFAQNEYFRVLSTLAKYQNPILKIRPPAELSQGGVPHCRFADVDEGTSNTREGLKFVLEWLTDIICFPQRSVGRHYHIDFNEILQSVLYIQGIGSQSNNSSLYGSPWSRLQKRKDLTW